MSDNHDFILFDRQMEAVDIMTDAQVGQLIKAMYHHNHGDEVTFEDPMVQMAFVMFWQAVEASRAKREKLRENGSKGGKAKSQNEQNVANGSKPVAKSSKGVASSSKDVADDSLLIDIDIDIDNIKRETTKEKSTIPAADADGGDGVKEPYSAEFNTFWTAYPRKVGKDAAWKSWKVRRKEHRLPPIGDILDKLEQFKASEQWQRDGGQYIPHPSTWISQGRWQDELTEETQVYKKPSWLTEPRHAGR